MQGVCWRSALNLECDIHHATENGALWPKADRVEGKRFTGEANQISMEICKPLQLTQAQSSDGINRGRLHPVSRTLHRIKR